MQLDPTQQINKNYYEKNAEQWTESKTHSFYAEKAFRAFVKYLRRGDKILDVGCGYGREIPLFLGIGHNLEYEGLDISEKFLEIAKSRYPQLMFHLGNLLDVESLPSGYDGCWAASTLQHVPEKDWQRLLGNIEKITNNNAIVFFSLPNDRPDSVSEEDMRHFTVFTHTQVMTLLKKRNWKILEEGELPGTRGSTKWRWYICKLP